MEIKEILGWGSVFLLCLLMLLLVLIGSVILRVLVGQWGVIGGSWIGPTSTSTITLVASGGSRTSGRGIIIIIIVNIMIRWSSVSRCH